jgi:hypothetical protein
MKTQKIAIHCADGTTVYMPAKAEGSIFSGSINTKVIITGVVIGMPFVAILAIAL